jgi:phage terminase large subunit-like protein
VPDFLSEAEAFPEGGHDDQVDAVSGAVALAAIPPKPRWGAI